MATKKPSLGLRDVHTIFHKHKVVGSLLVLAVLSITYLSVFAAASVTSPATGGSSISADTVGGTYTSLTGPVLTEGAVGDVGGTLGTIILNAPTGFEFDTGGVAPTVLITRVSGNGADTRNINSVPSGTSVAMTSVTSTALTFTVTNAGTNGVKNSLTWQNVRVRPTTGVMPNTGNLTVNGTASITGITANTTNFGTLTVGAGVKNKLAFSVQPSSTAVINTDFATKPVVQLQDQYGNVVTSDNTSTITRTAVLSSQTCGGMAGSGVLSSTPADATAVASGVKTYTAMQYSVAESIKICATSSGVTSALSNTINVLGGAPVVTGVSSSLANGSYTTGQVVPVTVTFDQSVTVTDTPQLTLSTGTPATTAVNYSSGSGTNTLTFNYTVAAGNSTIDLDYSSTSALALNGGTIKDTATNTQDAVLTLASPAAAGSLGAIKNIVIDTTTPTISEITPVTTPTNDNTPSYTFSSSEAGTITVSGGSCSSANTNAVVGNNVITFGPLSDGTFNCTITVTDAAGNVSTVLNVSSFVLDTTLPVVGQVTAVTTPGNDNTPAYTFSSTEIGSITYGGGCTSAGNPTASVGNNAISFDALADGTYGSCTITVTDGAGNISSVLNISSFTIDTAAPVLAEQTPVATPTNDNTPSYTFSSTEAGNISYGGGCTSVTTSAAVGNNTITFSALADGTYGSCTIIVTDAVGNVSTTLNITSFEVNTTPPVGPTLAEVTAVPTPDNNASPLYTFSSTATNGLATVTYGGACGNGSLADYTDGATTNHQISYGPLAEGVYNNCTISVTDGTGTSNLLTLTAFTVDLTAPALAQVTAVASPTNDTTPDYTFSTTENGTMTFGGACSTTPSAPTGIVAPGNKTVTFTALADGTYTNCTITITDAAGNVSSVLNVNSFTIDTTAPVLSENTAVVSPTNDTTPTYVFNSTEAGAITYGGDCSSAGYTNAVVGLNTVTFDALANGAHNNCTISVQDAVLNTSNLLNVSAFVIDTVAPAEVVDLAAASSTNTTITVSWTAPGDNLNVGTAASYDLRYSTAPINAGNFLAATAVAGLALPQVAGSAENFVVTGLTPATLYYFALITTDTAGNPSFISNVPSLSTTSIPVPPVVPPVVTPTQSAGAGNVSGIGKDECSGVQCFQRDNYKSILGQSETVKKPVTATNVLSCGRDARTAIPFTDIETDSSKLYIEDLYRKCILDGRSEKLFVPAGFVTRAEFVKVILNSNVLGEGVYANSFTDVKSNDWFSKYVAKALELGLIQAAEKFNPNDPITRSQALKILLLAKKVNNLEGYYAHFDDMDENDWFYHYVAYSRVKNLFEIKEVKVGKRGLVGNFYSFPKTLKQTDFGSDVQLLKEVLKQMGLFTGEMNQKYDNDLAKAVINFQSTHGIPASGNLDYQTIQALIKSDLSPRQVRYFMPEKNITRSELAAIVSLIDR